MIAAERGWTALAWLLLLLLVVSYPLRYAQQAAFGQVVIYTGLLRLVLFALIFAYAVAVVARQTAKEQFPVIATGYVLISIFLYNLMVTDFGVFYAAFGFNLFCLPPTIAVIFYLNAKAFLVRGDAHERRLVHRLLAIAIPVTAFGFLQYWFNTSFLRSGFSTLPRSEFGTAGQAVVRLTQLASIREIRANSIFDSAIDFGHFASLFAILCLGMALKHRQRPSHALTYTLLTGFFVAGVVSTNTRNMLLSLACSVAGCVLIYAGLSVRALIAASLAFVGLFYATIYGVIAIAPRYFAGFFDPVSLFQRARSVYVTVQQFVINADSPLHVLFGFGYMQSTDFSFLPTTIFDNTELDLYLYAGVCGLALFVAMLLVLFNFAVKQWRTTGGIAWLTVASLLMGFPLFSTINIDLDQPWFQFVFALLVSGAAVPEARNAVLPRRMRPVAGAGGHEIGDVSQRPDLTLGWRA